MSFDPKKKAIDELMSYLDGKDGEELGAAMKPKEDSGLDGAPAEKIGEPDGDEPMPGGMGDDEKPEVEGAEGSKMSPEELEELIEALQSKMGC